MITSITRARGKIKFIKDVDQRGMVRGEYAVHKYIPPVLRTKWGRMMISPAGFWKFAG